MTCLATDDIGIPPDLPFLPDLAPSDRIELQRQTALRLGLDPIFSESPCSGGVAAEMAVIPAGTFVMGAAEREFGFQPDEAPQHYVSIPRPFAIGRFTITAEAFDGFQRATGWMPRRDLIWAKGREPVINVRSQDAAAYARWLSECTNAKYRLPTEAEWECAARAGTLTSFSFGANVSCREVHFNALFPDTQAERKHVWRLPRCLPRPKALEVGSLPPNLWGLHEMHGNVWEMTSDPWTRSHLGSRRDGRANDHFSRWIVTKGGSWFDPAVRARSAARAPRLRDELDVNLGFRLVREF